MGILTYAHRMRWNGDSEGDYAVETIDVARRRLFKGLFKGAGSYVFKLGERKITIEVDGNGSFEATDNDLPYSSISDVVGGTRDSPY